MRWAAMASVNQGYAGFCLKAPPQRSAKTFFFSFLLCILDSVDSCCVTLFRDTMIGSVSVCCCAALTGANRGHAP